MYKKDISKNQTDYLGYIEIKNLNIKREIVIGINDYNLLNHVTMNDNCISFECDNIILAGHSIKNIFLNLKNIKVNDSIILYNGKQYNYIVKSIDIVDKKNINIIDNSELILITCYDFNRRIIVKAKRI
ncbi:MAG: sortase [Bacilli bacterium]|nr:sortase [Bacilli bacterium]